MVELLSETIAQFPPQGVADPPICLAEVGKMYCVYVLKSKKNLKQYIGFTSKSPRERLKEHNNGSNKFTRQNGPFELIHFEMYNDKVFASKRERFLKSGRGRSFLRIKLNALS